MKVVTRSLQPPADLGEFEIGTPQSFYNEGEQGSGSISDPTIVIAFAHDDVEDSLNAGANAYGKRKVTHYEGGCTNEIVPPVGGSAIGETIMAPSDDLSATETGLDDVLPNEITSAVQTTIHYPMALLDANEAITAFCPGTSLGCAEPSLPAFAPA